LTKKSINQYTTTKQHQPVVILAVFWLSWAQIQHLVTPIQCSYIGTKSSFIQRSYVMGKNKNWITANELA